MTENQKPSAPSGIELPAILGRTDLFAASGGEALTAIASAMVERVWRSGALLFSAGDESDGFYIVREGLIRLGLETGEGGELTLRDAGPGEVFGEIGALDGGPRSASARAVSQIARTMFMSRARFDAVLAAHPALALSIARKLCSRLRDTTDQLEGIALYSLRQRLARFIMAQGAARGAERSGSWREIAMPVSQGVLATILGASRPKINGALQELEKAGAISRKDSLFLYHPDKITAEAEGRANAPS